MDAARWRGVVLAITAIAGLPGTVLADHTPGHVDIGDGNLARVVAEICFSKSQPSKNNELKRHYPDDLNRTDNQCGAR